MVFTVPYTGDPQPAAGRRIQRTREGLGLGVQDLCDLVKQQSTPWGRVSITRGTLAGIEAGVIPLPARKYAICSVLGLEQDDVWVHETTRRRPINPTSKGATR